MLPKSLNIPMQGFTAFAKAVSLHVQAWAITVYLKNYGCCIKVNFVCTEKRHQQFVKNSSGLSDKAFENIQRAADPSWNVKNGRQQ